MKASPDSEPMQTERVKNSKKPMSMNNITPKGKKIRREDIF
jgi:hypothetical protein